MVLCCFGGKLAAANLHQEFKALSPNKASPGAKDSEVAVEACEASSGRQEQHTVHDTLSTLRCQLAIVQGTWLARIRACMESVLAACGPVGQVCLFGASPCGSVLVLLGTAGSGANGVMSPGHVLPVPEPWLGTGVGGCTGSAAVVAVGAISSTSGGLVILGSPARAPYPPGAQCAGKPDVLMWQGTDSVRHGPAWEVHVLLPLADQSANKGRTNSHLPPPNEWRQVLDAMAAEAVAAAGSGSGGGGALVDTVGAVKPSAPPAALRAYLVPLRLGTDLVGALLMVAATAAAPPPPLKPALPTPDGASRKGEVAAQAPPIKRELLMGVAASVAECCMGPHLTDIQRVTLAACELATAPDLQGIASCISSAVTEALASELHVDFAVRLALVPYVPGMRGTPQYGFLLTEQPAATTTQPQVPTVNGCVQGGNQNTALSGNVAGLESLSRLPTAHGPVLRAATRSLTQQAFAERLFAAKLSGGVPSGSSPCVDHFSCTLTTSQPSPPQLPLAGLGATGAVASGVHSFQLTGMCGRRLGGELPARVWKARPFSLESTLLASLAAKVAKSCNSGINGPPATMAAVTGLGLICPAVSVLSQCPLDDGGASSGIPSPMPRCAAHTTIPGGYSTYMTIGSSLMTQGCGGGGGGGGAGLRVYRMGGTVVPHVHAYVNDTDQPSADVVLLLRTAVTGTGATGHGMRGGGGGSSYPALAGGGAGTAGNGPGGGPVSLVLVMGSVELLTTADVNRGAAMATIPADTSGEHAPSTAAVARSPGRGTGNGMALQSPSSSLWPAPVLHTAGSIGVGGGGGGGGGGGSGGGGGGGGGGSGGFNVCLALYLTSHERLPASLLCAARDRSQVLLELLLPAIGACLSDSASAELQYLWEAVSGSAGGAATNGGASGMLGRAASLPTGRVQPKSPPLTAEDGNLQPLHGPLNLQHHPHQHQSLHSGPGAVASVATVDLAANGPLPLQPTAAATARTGGSVSGCGAASSKAMTNSCSGNIVATSLSFRGCGAREMFVTAPSMGAPSPGGPVEAAEADGAALTQLLLTRGTNNITTSTAPEIFSGNVATTTILGSALMTGNGAGWTTLASLGATALGRDTSEAAARVPRSRLSNINTTGYNPALVNGATTPGTAGGSAFMNSYNSLAAALMCSGSITGRGPGTAGGSTEETGAASAPSTPVLSPPAGAGAGPTLPLPPSPLTTQQQQQSAPNVPRRTMLLLQQQQQQQQQTNAIYPVSTSGARALAHGRVHPPPRRQLSDLLATMPWDVSDTLTVMRTNMDILVSSFWNTLRSQTTEAAPSPHADEDLRFLRLLRAIGGGGCSTVYLGLLHGLEVAVKVMKAPTSDDVEGDGADEGDEDAGATARQQRQQQASNEPSAPPAARQAQLRAIMRGARELAVMTSISHPNIVQIYSYHTRVLVKFDAEEASGAGGAGRISSSTAMSGKQLPRLTPVAEANVNSTPGPLQTVLIMECCDLGSLADALDNGMFSSAIRNAEAARWRPGPRRSQTVALFSTTPADTGAAMSLYGKGSGGGVCFGGNMAGRGTNVAGGVAMRAIYLTLLEVALALRHMHAMQLVHCDVKPANVLLKSSASDPRGFTCKLTDFGFVNLLQYHVEDVDDPRARPSMKYHEPVGTVTHLAPETMVQGSKLDHTVDIFAFGILMWEVYTGKAPYAEHANNNFRDVPFRVVREGLRPTFPSSTPLAFKSLAQACWSTDASRRPTAAVLVASLQRLMDAASR